PLDADASGLPVAVLRYRVANTAKEHAKVAIAFSLDNPAGLDLRKPGSGIRSLTTSRRNEYRSSDNLQGLFMTNPETAKDSPLFGSFALSLINVAEGKVTHLTGWPSAKWWASPLLFRAEPTVFGEIVPEQERAGTI